jgi:hypothetical protein
MQMMRKRLVGVLALGVLLWLPATAHASNPLGWLDKLSGPGPFDANGRLFLPVPVTTTKDGVRAFADGIDERRLYVVFETARFTGETNPNFVGAVNITTMQGVVFLHPEGWRNAKEPSALSALDVGAGFGLYRFSGAGVISDGKPDGASWRGVIPIRIRLTPSELFARQLKAKHSRWRNGLAVFSYMIGWDVIPGTFDATDFVVSPSNAGYHSSGNAPFTCGIIVDITPVLFK